MAVILHGHVDLVGTPEGDDLGVLQSRCVHSGEEFQVLGLEPGLPASMERIHRASNRSMILILSFTEEGMPWAWGPSHRVES